MKMRWWVTATVFLLVLVLATLRGGRPWVARVRRNMTRVSKSPAVAMGAIFILAILLYALPSILFRVPSPVVHDEFAYLLQGDTFFHGRLSNPPHPMARFFETFHVLQSPTYAAKFPPGLGIMLAIGYAVGLPLAGVWLSLALGCVAIYWMLRGVVSNRWAALGALLAAIHPTVVWFSQSYWGGGVSILGGALLAGALLRVQLVCHREHSGHGEGEENSNHLLQWGVVAGLGMGILALSRPFEGMLFSAACAIAILIATWRGGMLKVLLMRFVPAAIGIPLLTVGWFMYYDWRVTGKPLVMPYVLHTARYMVAPLFFWQSIPPTPVYPNEQMQQFHLLTEYKEYADATGWRGYWLGALIRGGMIGWAYLRPAVLAFPLVAAIVAGRRSSRFRPIVLPAILICGGALMVHLLSCPWMRIAYMAPLFGLVMILLIVGMRHLGAWRLNGHPLGRSIVHAVVAVHLLTGAFILVDCARANAKLPISQRDEFLAMIRRQPGKHLVLVRYSKDHSPMQEWVYNGADIDAQDVIFARDLGGREDAALLDYYKDRTRWIVDVDRHQARLSMVPNSPSALTTLTPEP
jgi:hypothetical protein